MKILSWDVGIIHLAYCILEYNSENNKFKIHSWEQINIASDKVDTKCNCCNKNGKYYCLNSKDEKVFLCGTHKKKYVPIQVTLEDLFIKVGKLTSGKDKGNTCQFESKVKCSKNSTYQAKTNLDEKLKFTDSYKEECHCTVHAKSIIKKINNSRKLQSSKKVNSMKLSIDTLRYNLVSELESRPHLLNVDKVLIENQPAFKNPKMKAISSTIYDYFLIRGMFDKERTKSVIESVKYICPSNKLKVNEDNTIQTLSKTSDNKKYKMTKQLGVQYCKQLIKHDQSKLDFLATQKKKDDLCDAFLQGAHYLSLQI